jgi:hypothetical protein
MFRFPLMGGSLSLDVYARAMTPAKLEAQGWVLRQLLVTDTKAAA